MRKHGDIKGTVLSTLADGCWHGYPEMYEKLAPMISPDECLRRCRMDRYSIDELSQAVVKGRQRLVHNFMNDLKYEGRIERRGAGLNAEYRKLTNGEQRTS